MHAAETGAGRDYTRITSLFISQCMFSSSLVPRPFGGGGKGLGTTACACAKITPKRGNRILQ